MLAAAGGALAVISVRAAMPAVVGAPTRVLLLGTGSARAKLARDVETEADGLFQVVGFADTSGASPAAAPALAFVGNVDHMARRLKAEVVVVAVEDRRVGLPIDALLACRTRGVQVMSDVTFAEATLKRIPLEILRPSALIFDEGFRVSSFKRAVKRALDLALAVGMLLATLRSCSRPRPRSRSPTVAPSSTRRSAPVRAASCTASGSSGRCAGTPRRSARPGQRTATRASCRSGGSSARRASTSCRSCGTCCEAR